MLSLKLSREIYKEVLLDVVGCLSRRSGIDEKEIWLWCLEEKEIVKDEKDFVEKDFVEKDFVVKDEKDFVVKDEIVKESGCVLPWCGKVNESCCRALKLNNGLHTQCNRLKGKENYCGSCIKLIEKNGGSAPYGTVDDRMKCDILDYIDPKGKATIPYANVMKKLNINKEEALKEAKRLGISIPECHFEEKKGKRGRPSKGSAADDTGSETSDGEKKKRGRPKKTKEVVNNNAGEDLIASLLEQENIKEEVVEEVVVEEVVEEEETKVIKFEIDGKTYLKSEDNVLYDFESHDAIGLWNEITKKIDEIPDEDEE